MSYTDRQATMIVLEARGTRHRIRSAHHKAGSSIKRHSLSGSYWTSTLAVWRALDKVRDERRILRPEHR